MESNKLCREDQRDKRTAHSAFLRRSAKVKAPVCVSIPCNSEPFSSADAAMKVTKVQGSFAGL